MLKYILISIITFIGLSASAQQMNTGSSHDYKHPQMAQKAKQEEQAKLAKDTSKYELVYDKTDNYKNQTNNTLKVKGRRKKNKNNAPTNTDPNMTADYKHPHGLR